MQEIARFLAAHPPFDGLPPEALAQTAATVEVAYFPHGASILRQGAEPSRHLHVIVKGLVEVRQADERGGTELVETLAEGETFGQLSLLSRSPPVGGGRPTGRPGLPDPRRAGRAAAAPARVRGAAGSPGRRRLRRSPAASSPGVLGPALAAVLVTAATQGSSGVGELLRCMGRWRIGPAGWLLAASPLGLGALAVLVAGLAGHGWAEPGRAGPLQRPAHPRYRCRLAAGTGRQRLGEEAGWRGYAQQQLQRRRGALAATLVVAVLWAAWHAPMFAVFDSYQSLGVAAVPGFFLGLACGAVVLTWVYNCCGHSILAAAVWHGCYNLAAATQASQGTVAAVVTTAVMVWALVLVVLEVRANRRGASILAAEHDPGSDGTRRTPR